MRHPFHLRRWWLLAALQAVPALLLTGCAQALRPDAATPLLLLGELHDNAVGHALRLQTLTERVQAGARPALLMEQFDRERQAEIDRAVQAAPGMPPGDAEFTATVDALIKLGSATTTGWTWDFYRPYLQLALRYRLPIVAANVSRGDARSVMQQGLAATGFAAEVPADIAASLADDIQRSHCGMISAPQAGRMALAQVARDQFMARQVQAHAGRGVVLLAGNGHVRKDVGVPRWLGPDLRGRATAVAYLEADDDAAKLVFDEVVLLPTQPRDDPCKHMRARAPPAASTVLGPGPNAD